MIYEQAPKLAQKGEKVVSNDEMTGVQALERKHPGLPLRPGKVERREFEYIRHGTLAFIINFEVATGQIGLVSCGPTRTEQDYLNHIQATVAAEPVLIISSASSTPKMTVTTSTPPTMTSVACTLGQNADEVTNRT